MDFIHFNSISEVHRVMGFEKPQHPLISIFQHKPGYAQGMEDMRITSSLYFIALKEGFRGSFAYGRNSYDFEEGSMIFMAPGQVMGSKEVEEESDARGWSLLFHPDLIRKSELGKTIDSYSFFDYEVNEALHISDKEKKVLNDLLEKIQEEIASNIDKHSQKLIVTNVQLLLDYCTRYYDRQFYTRSNLNQDVFSRFEHLLKEYFRSEKQLATGIPSVRFCSEKLNMSANYLSDLLKKETGRNAQDHIHSFVIDKAKTLLLNSNEPVSQVAFGLGFEYSQHFSKMFKAKTGMSPREYRSVN
ncbi:MAG: helix-turn-helix domain-containing protein [Bacteroidia bacterium]|nr:helix-turn-helix domain-containing protein [Bacteroidia bacterium]